MCPDCERGHRSGSELTRCTGWETAVVFQAEALGLPGFYTGEEDICSVCSYLLSEFQLAAVLYLFEFSVLAMTAPLSLPVYMQHFYPKSDMCVVKVVAFLCFAICFSWSWGVLTLLATVLKVLHVRCCFQAVWPAEVSAANLFNTNSNTCFSHIQIQESKWVNTESLTGHWLFFFPLWNMKLLTFYWSESSLPIIKSSLSQKALLHSFTWTAQSISLSVFVLWPKLELNHHYQHKGQLSLRCPKVATVRRINSWPFLQNFPLGLTLHPSATLSASALGM